MGETSWDGRGRAERAGETGVLDDGALGVLGLAWGNAWDIDGCGLRWQAARRDGTGCVLTWASADRLVFVLRISQGSAR